MTRPGRINICFHGIGTPGRELEPGERDYWITQDQYASILDELTTWPDVRISFDDGNHSDVAFALAPLVERGLRADFFVVVGRLGMAGSLGPQDLQVLLEAEMSVGTHGMDHRAWTNLDDEERFRELVTARSDLESLIGREVTEAALPLGAYDRRVLAELRKLRYRHVYNSDRRPARRGAWMQPRYSVRHDDDPSSLRAAVLHRQQPGQRLRGSLVATMKSVR